MQTFEGEVEFNWEGINIGEASLYALFANYSGKRVRITIEEIAPESKPEEKIQIRLGRITESFEACISFGINPYCINEGADPDQWVVVSLKEAKLLGLI